MRGGFFFHLTSGKEEDFRLSQLDRRALGRLLEYLKPHLGTLAAAMLAMLLFSAGTVAGPYVLKLAIDNFIIARDLPGLALMALLYLALHGLAWFGSYWQSYLSGKVGQEVVFAIRRDLFWHVENLSLDFFQRHPTGAIMSRITHDVNALGELVSSGLVNLVNDLLTLGGIVVIMLALQPRLALLAFLTFPLIYFSTAWFGRKLRRAYRDVQARLAAVNAQLQENIAGMRVVQSLTRERENLDRFEEVNLESMRANLQAMVLFALYFPTVTLTGSLGTALVLWYGSRLVMAGDASLGLLVAFIAYVRRFFTPLRELSQVYNTYQAAGAALDRIYQYLELAPTLAEPAVSRTPPGGFTGAVELKDVTFAYEPDRPVLVGVNLRIEAGTTLALVGPSGAGKTTLANLLARLYDPDGGQILLDGTDLRDISRENLREVVVVVPQEPFLFATSILENIRYARPEATDNEVVAAAEAAGVGEMVKILPQGYATPVGPGGTTLSGGQKQLVALARAFLLNPKVLVLDEATSRVDAATEAQLHQALHRLLDGRTGIIIAHRPQTLKLAREIAVLSEGRVIARGSHRQLLRESELYRRLYEWPTTLHSCP